MARNAAAHAGRTLVVFLLGIAVLFGLVALGGTWKPALGLDLQGGTRITLTANGNPTQGEPQRGRVASSTSASTAPASPRPR